MSSKKKKDGNELFLTSTSTTQAQLYVMTPANSVKKSAQGKSKKRVPTTPRSSITQVLPPGIVRSRAFKETGEVIDATCAAEFSDTINAAVCTLRQLYRTKYILSENFPAADKLYPLDQPKQFRLGDIPNVPVELAKGKKSFEKFLAEIESEMAGMASTSAGSGSLRSDEVAMRKIEHAFSELEGKLQVSENIIRKLYEKNAKVLEENEVMRKELIKLLHVENNDGKDEGSVKDGNENLENLLRMIQMRKDDAEEEKVEEDTSNEKKNEEEKSVNDEVLGLNLDEQLQEMKSLNNEITSKLEELHRQQTETVSSSEEVERLRSTVERQYKTIQHLVSDVASAKDLSRRQIKKQKMQFNAFCNFVSERDMMIYRLHRLLLSMKSFFDGDKFKQGPSVVMHFTDQTPSRDLNPLIAIKKVLSELDKRMVSQVRGNAKSLAKEVFPESGKEGNDEPEDSSLVELNTTSQTLSNLALYIPVEKRKKLVEIMSEFRHRFRTLFSENKTLRKELMESDKKQADHVMRLMTERALLRDSLAELAQQVGVDVSDKVPPAQGKTSEKNDDGAITSQ